MTKTMKAVVSAFVVVMLAFALLGAMLTTTVTKTAENKVDFSLTSEESKLALVTEDGKSDYTIIFASSGEISNTYELAQAVQYLFIERGAIRVGIKSDALQKALAHEVLIGHTNRDESEQLLAQLEDLCENSDDLAWGYAVIGEKLVFAANSQIAFNEGKDAFVEYLAECNLVLDADLCVTNVKTMAQYEKEQAEAEAAARQQRIDELIAMNAKFEDSQFNTDKYSGEGKFYKPMSGAGGHFTGGASSGAPWAYPAENTHPRYLITESNIDTIKEILEEGKDPDSEYYYLAEEFWKRANTSMEDINYGEFTDQYKNTAGNSWLEPTGEPYRYNGTTLGIIDSKAMAYLVTGDEIYAYEAIVAIKNAMLSLKYTTDLHMDVYHGPSHVMVTLAAVYDWCYDMLSETDKWHMIWGTAQILGPQMENGMRYPPSGMNGINGHGTGPQLLRDWMTMATVFYDEAPDWWEFVAGRYFNEYLPTANYQFENGWVSQGTACYAPIKIHVQAWAAYLVYLSTGENFLTEDANQTMYYFISQITPRATNNPHQQFYFQTGDGSRNTVGTQVGFAEFFVIAALYNDPVILAQAVDVCRQYRNFDYGTIFTMTPSFMLAFTSAVDSNGEDARDGVETIQYFADPAGQLTIREEWGNPDSIAVLLRLMNLTMSNHEGYDHGTFQIYYKGLLAATSGAYAKYGSNAHYYYHQATIAHNGLLVFNPALADAEPVMNGDNIANPARYLYSGSQIRKNISTANADAWLETGRMVYTIGASYGYDKNGNAKYAYLAGDLSPAYDTTTAEYIARHMFTLFTGDEDFPAIVVTYDQITAVNENFRKTWLLHILKEPEVDIDNLSATVINGEGKMYVESLYGAKSIVKIGGEGKAWWINGYFKDPDNRGSWDERTQSFTDPDNIGSWIEGKNAQDGFAKEDNYQNIWGRIELRAEGEKSTNFLTLMAVTDTDNEAELNYTKFSAEAVQGLQFGNSVIAFANTNAKYYKEFSFTTEGKGLYEYYIANLEAGTWQVIVDGVSVAYSLAEEDGAMLTFTAPTGDVTIKPGNDVIGANGGRIQYNTGGAVMPKDAPYTYRNENATPLPTELVRGEDKFVAWYTSPNYEPETMITEIPAGTTGTVKLYAKWISNFLNEDYSLTEINHQEANRGVNGVSYNGSTKTGSSFITKYDEELGRHYLEWLEGTNDPIINQTSSQKNFSMLGSDDKCVSFTYSLRLEEGMTPMRTHVRLIAKKDVYGNSISSTTTILFQTDTKGNVTTYDGGTLCKLSVDSVTDIRVVVDFKKAEMRYYDADYNLVATDKWTPPSTTGTTSTEEFLKCLTEYLWYFYGGTGSDVTDAALRIYGIRVQEGDEFTGLAKPQTEGIKYNPGAGKLPEDAPKEFNSDGSITLLPADMTLPGYVFDGWYTTPTFDEGTRTTYAPAGATGLYEVWAKWNIIFIDEDWSGVDIDHSEENKTINNISYNGNTKVGSSYKTMTEGGKKFLVWTPGASDPLIMSQNSTSNVSTMTDTKISYTLTLGKHGNADVPNFEFRIIGKHTVTGETGKGDSAIYIGKINGGKFTLGNASTVIAEIGEEAVTIRVVLDFATGKIEAYDEWGAIIASENMPAIPEYSGATSYLEWMDCFRTYIFYSRRTGGSADKMTQAIRFYKLRVEEGNAFALAADEEPPKANSIIYDIAGGTLPEGAPTEYDPALGTLLPSDVTKPGYVFGGWYTDSDYSQRIDYIPFGGASPVKVYAKWVAVVLSEDWNDDEFVHPESTNVNRDGFIYNTGSANELKPGTGFETVKEANGNTYVKFYSPSHGIFLVPNNNGSYQFPSFKETAMSFEFEYGRDGDIPLANNYVRLQTSGSNYGQYQFLTINGATGEVKLQGSAEPFAVIGDEMVKIRITIDFENLTVTAYGENNEVLDSMQLGAVPTSKAGNYQPTTWVEWMKYASGYYIYNQLSGPAGFTVAEGNVWGGRFDNFVFYDGRAYNTFATELPKTNSIKYELNGGTLPESAPTEYDPEAETMLPTPTKDGYAFAGWYTTKTFEEGTRVEKIAAGTEGVFSAYAKWVFVFADEDFTGSNLNIDSGSPKYNKIGFNAMKDGTVVTTGSVNGDEYAKIQQTSGDAIIMLQNGSYNLTNMADTSLSIQMDLIYTPDTTLSNLQFRIATDGNAYGQISLGMLYGASGEIKLTNSSIVIANLKELGRYTVRLYVDFVEGTVAALDAEGNIIDKAIVAVPTAKEGNPQPATLAEWQRVAKTYLFYGYMNSSSKEAPVSYLGFDNILVVEGCIYNIQPAPEAAIKYEVNGGILPENAPKDHNPDAETVLPEPTKNGYIFDGWYTDSSFDDATRVEKIATSATESVTVYAKWLYVFADADFEESAFTGEEKNWVYNENLNMLPKEGTSNVQTVVDESGNKYLKVSISASDFILTSTNSSYNLKNMNATSLSFKMDIIADANTPLPSTNIKIATDGSAYGQLEVAGVKSTTKEIYLKNGTVPIADLSSGRVTIRITVDFAAGTATAYDIDGNAIDTVELVVPTAKADKTQPETLAEWQKVASSYLLYIYTQSSVSLENGPCSIGYDNVLIVEGNIFA